MKIHSNIASAALSHESGTRPISQGKQQFTYPDVHAPVSLPIPKLEGNTAALPPRVA